MEPTSNFLMKSAKTKLMLSTYYGNIDGIGIVVFILHYFPLAFSSNSYTKTKLFYLSSTNQKLEAFIKILNIKQLMYDTRMLVCIES